jgi:threonine dehydrogenase-like Zn-dependent dehydrogenase
VRAGERAPDEIKELTGGSADVSVDAFGGSVTIVPGILSLRKSDRHVQLGLTGKDDRGIVSLPIDAMVAQEIQSRRPSTPARSRVCSRR